MSVIVPSETYVQELQAELEKIQGKVDELQGAVNSVLSNIPAFVPDFVVDKVHDAWNSFCDKIGACLQNFWDVLDKIGDPGAMRTASTSWTEQVSAPVGEQASVPFDMESDDSWEGVAAGRYRDSIVPQRTAPTDVRDKLSNVLSSSLSDLANALVSFISACRRSLIALAVAIATAIAGCASLIGAPAAILGCVAAIAIALGDYLYHKDALSNEAQTFVSTMGTAKADSGSSLREGGYAWPRVATA